MISHALFYNMYNNILLIGNEVVTRNLRVKEIENFCLEIPPYCRFVNFESRKLNLDYIKAEFLWYLKGDPKDLSICQHASIWNKCINSNEEIYSNYGQYIFTLGQFDAIKNMLIKDKFSRRASIIILQPYHILDDKAPEIPCTYNIAFRIRENKLNMTVKMRSQDAYFGFASDVPTFSFVQEMLYNSLLEYYPDLQMGNYFHFVDSFHLYEDKWPKVEKILSENSFIDIECPKISGPDEVKHLMNIRNESPKFEFSKWLSTFEKQSYIDWWKSVSHSC